MFVKNVAYIVYNYANSCREKLYILVASSLLGRRLFMTAPAKKRVQYLVEKAILESTEKVDQDGFNAAKLKEVSLSLPTAEVITDDDIAGFFENDGGY